VTAIATAPSKRRAPAHGSRDARNGRGRGLDLGAGLSLAEREARGKPFGLPFLSRRTRNGSLGRTAKIQSTSLSGSRQPG
jgi:hypothetical protein